MIAPLTGFGNDKLRTARSKEIGPRCGSNPIAYLWGPERLKWRDASRSEGQLATQGGRLLCAASKVGCGAILRIRRSPEYWQVSADSGRSQDRILRAEFDPFRTFARIPDACSAEYGLCVPQTGSK
jgi:hypothetical protein